MGDPRLATIEDADVLAHIAAAGFYDDPVMSWVLPSADKRLAQLTFLFTGMVADMVPTGEHRQTASDRVQDPPEDVTAPLSLFAPDEMERLGILGEAMMAAHPHEPHWYLNVLSTLPARQGQGLGAAVLQPVLAICDAEGIRAYLESTNPKNMTLYRRQGFVETGEIRLSDGPSLHQMWRDPAGG